jgi:filamentous hemagglutinin
MLALCVSLGISLAYAGDSHIVADPTAPGNQRPQILPTGNGLPQVNINTPNSNGLSYNRYQQFDVGQQGAILNNATQHVQTQLGGWIEKNPNLIGGAASLIVNEVNS